MPTQITLKTITPTRIKDGGYTIKWEGVVPPASTVYLCLVTRENRLDITGGYTKQRLPQLLAAIEAVNGWGQSVECLLTVEEGGAFLTESNAQPLQAPVVPYVGDLTFDGFWRGEPKFTYPGVGQGRLLSNPISGKYYVRYGSRFETEGAKRGFDCTTFPMALFRCQASMAGKVGADLAHALGAQPCEMESRKEKEVKAFFGDENRGAKGLYIMFSSAHVVLVKDAIVHEFTNRGYVDPGYKRAPTASWQGYKRAPQGLWSVRK